MGSGGHREKGEVWGTLGKVLTLVSAPQVLDLVILPGRFIPFKLVVPPLSSAFLSKVGLTNSVYLSQF